MTPAATVYLATNTVNGHTYVGVTRFTPERRWQGHRSVASRSPVTYLHRAIARYGAEAFSLEPVASVLSVEYGSEVERAVISRMAPTYNQTNGGEFTSGRKHTPETIARIVAGNVGKRRTPEQKAANSAQAKARWASDPKYREMALAASAKGRANTDQQKRIASVRKVMCGRKMDPEHKERLRAISLGSKRSKESIASGAEKRNKSVVCIETGLCFKSVSQASASTGISISGISMVCLGKRSKVHGLTFKFNGFSNKEGVPSPTLLH